MKNMILADVERILKKKSFWIVFIIPCILAVLYALATLGDHAGGFYFATLEVNRFVMLPNLLFGISIFLGVYGDEFRSKSMQAMIGRGISRTKIVLVKFIDSLLLTAFLYGMFMLLLFALSIVFFGGLGVLEAKAMYLSIAFCGLKMIGISSAATVVIFLTGNVPVSVMTVIVLNISSLILRGIAVFSEPLQKLRPERYFFGGIIDRIYTDLMLDQPVGVIWILTAAAYIAAAVFLSVVIFRGKELEF